MITEGHRAWLFSEMACGIGSVVAVTRFYCCGRAIVKFRLDDGRELSVCQSKLSPVAEFADDGR